MQKIQPLAVHQSPMTRASALQLSRQWSCTPSIPCVTKRTHLFPHAWSVEYYGNLGVCVRALSLQQRLRLAQGLKPTIDCENSLYPGKKVFHWVEWGQKCACISDINVGVLLTTRCHCYMSTIRWGSWEYSVLHFPALGLEFIVDTTITCYYCDLHSQRLWYSQ